MFVLRGGGLDIIDFLSLCKDYQRHGLFAQAVEGYKEILKKNSSNTEALHYMGMALIQMKDICGLELVKKSLIINPSNEKFLHNYKIALKLISSF
ncbi:tetratricopeptide repeat protein [Desulfobotulus mexicanus]|uniref:Tetratricopeptide repeat protein n=1 Tax=Desulfobotulus mexicanus TaxID=2586642 RepID=A0A5S5MC79_9BACT|nr:hypothetical protein [Desulfobotulus mexicanus]TYT73323.1 hypothetical protein FIM25_15745 [Desulfobotulus mexicanus]